MEIVFEGSLQSPRVIEVPGLLAPGEPPYYEIFWGESIDFSFPDPLVIGTYRLVVKGYDYDINPIVQYDIVRTDQTGPLTYTIPGTVSRFRLHPGVYFFQLLKSYTAGDGTRYLSLAEGTFTIVEGPASRDVPIDCDDSMSHIPGPDEIYQAIDLILNGTLVTGQYFGYFQVPKWFNLTCRGMQLILQTVAVGGPVEVLLAQLDDSNNPTDTAFMGSLPDNTFANDTDIDPPLAMPAGSKWRAKLVQSGAPGTEGQFLTCRLDLKVAGRV